MDLSDFEKDPRLFLFTSLTAGSSHIITATSRMETILKANKIPFQAIDTATDEKARRLWQRRAQKRKLPGLVKDGFVIADLEEVEEWNEFGELKENIGNVPLNHVPPPDARQGVNIRPVEQSSSRQPDVSEDVPHPAASPTASALVDPSSRIALPGAAEIAARNKSKSPPADLPPLDSVTSPSRESEDQSGTGAKETAPASEPSGSPDDGTVRTHRGSEVKFAPTDEIKKLESETALQEDPSEEAVDDTAQGIEDVKLEDSQESKDQESKVSADAATTAEN